MMQIKILINLAISTACKGATGIAPEYDYTQLGETWSTPRIVRIPDVTTTGSVLIQIQINMLLLWVAE